MQRVPVAVHDVLRFRHVFLEAGIVGRKLVATIRCLDQEQSIAIRGAQAADHFPGQYDPERVSELSDLEFNQGSTSLWMLLRP
jgi:hypothetical protein